MKNIILHDREYVVNIEYDQFTTAAPWENSDGYGIVSDWVKRGKRSGELILNSEKWAFRYYDFAGTIKLAACDGWGLAPSKLKKLTEQKGRIPTPREIVVEAVMSDYERLRAWYNDEWHYIGVNVTAPDGETESVWGIESDADDYIQDVAQELAQQLNNVWQDKQTEEATL